MKKLLITLCIATVLFAACKEKQEPACPMVDAELVPAVVKDSLAARYPGVSVEVWYKVDAVGYCAKIQQAPNTIFAHFGIDGSFKEEERKDPSGKEVDGDDIQDENQNEDDSCECR